MDPHLLLLIFLPIIGFSAAISQEPHMLRKSWGQVKSWGRRGRAFGGPACERMRTTLAVCSVQSLPPRAAVYLISKPSS
jgi:hypothetical protein